MDSNTSLSFCYSQAAGLLSKSFLKNKVQTLFAAKTLEEMWNLLFKEPCPLIPQTLLADQIESKAYTTLIQTYTKLINQFDKPSFILLSQLEYLENENLKLILDAVAHSEPVCPKLIDLGKFATIKAEHYPDLEKITKGSDYFWLNKSPEPEELQITEVKMDLYLIRSLWKEIQTLSGEEKAASEKFFIEEYAIKNIIWAMRLNVYFKKTREEIISELFYVTSNASVLDPIASPALKILDFDVKDFGHWQKWKYAQYLNPYDGGEWKLDPAWFEQRYNAGRAKKYVTFFHQHSTMEISLVAWFKIKLYELNCIRSAVEGLRLNISPADAMKALGIMSE